MDLAPGMFGREAVHEIEELDAPAALIMAGLDQAVATSRAANRVVVP